VKLQNHDRFCDWRSVVGVKIGFRVNDCRDRSSHEENRDLEGLDLERCISLNCQKLGGNSYFGKDQTHHFIDQHCLHFKVPNLINPVNFTAVLFVPRHPWFKPLNLPLILFLHKLCKILAIALKNCSQQPWAILHLN
jgi:hypothetical protein